MSESFEKDNFNLFSLPKSNNLSYISVVFAKSVRENPKLLQGIPVCYPVDLGSGMMILITLYD